MKNFCLPNRLPTPYRCEADIVAMQLAALEGALDWPAAARQAAPWVQAARSHPPPFWAMESLLREYPLSSNEGLALMRLAEALLRIPDADTAIALTADQLSRADFEGAGNAALTSLSSAAISISKHFLPDADSNTQPGLLAKLGAKTVVTATLRAVQLLGKQFVLGQTIDEALDVARAERKKAGRTFAGPPQQRLHPLGEPSSAHMGGHLAFSFDMLGEGARTQVDADAYFASYANAIKSIALHADSSGANGQKGLKNTAIAGDGISIKLSALHPRYEWAQHERVMAELVPRVWQLCELAARSDMNLTIDAEEVDRLELSLNVFEALLIRIADKYPQWGGFGLALQAYQSRAIELIDEVARIARKHQVKLMCRLVKGAYWDAEIKRAQELGLAHYPVFTHKHHTDVSYLACVSRLLAAKDVIYPQFATHNAATIAAIMQLASKHGAPFELQRLHGMGEGIYREVLKNPLIRVRIYAPVGAHRDLLAYLVRRLLENGANSSFVHQLTDETVRVDELLASPLYLSAAQALPLPADLFGAARRNSAGFDLADETHRAPMRAAYAAAQVPFTPVFDIKETVSRHGISVECYQIWSIKSVEQRAAILRKAADALEAQTPRFCALLVREAHKTWGDAVAEVREAVDFLRYYASEAERVMQPIALNSPTGETNELRLKARGVWVCISPWNFPLAIFLGQVAAALATGNTVLAKPAEQTPFVAMEAAKLLHAAGVPEAALQVLHGPGETTGASLVALENIAGVVFTGSTQVAKIINRALAAKDGAITPLIAETGGINAMLVDSSALPEQVVDAAIQSAFKSAGQRCSALRLLCVHDAIADKVIDMLHGAAAELACGSPAHPATDVGPLIDRLAYDGIQKLLTNTLYKEKQSFEHAESALSATESIANLMPPQIVEIDQLSDLTQEVFAPVLHIYRYGRDGLTDPHAVIQQINAMGYGLTLGIQTRIDSRAQQLSAAAHIGNIYINRNMIGAVVGVQPFGGQGLSGTGPKAGGPHYLLRFCAEQTITVNTAAAGGNAALLAS